MNDKVKIYLEDLQISSKESFEIVNVIRNLFFSCSEELIEEIKYGGILFQKGETILGGIFNYKEHISIEFSSGSGFNDPNNILEGNGKFRRHIKIRTIEDIKSKQVNNFIKLAFK